MTLALGIMASGTGTNAQAMIDAIAKGSLDAEIRLIFSNKADAKVLDRAKAAGIPTAVLNHTAYATREAFDADLVQLFKDAKVDTIAMAGYMRIITPVLLNAFPQRILNIHPALLPAFAGAHAIEDTLEWGVRIGGCTVHFVDAIVDHGPIIIQAAVPAIPGESREAFATRIHACEYLIYPQALSWLAQDRLRFIGEEKRWVELLPPEHIQEQAKQSAPQRAAPLASFAHTSLIVPSLDLF